MHHNHQTHSYPAHKPIPKDVVKNLTAGQRRVAKKQHKKRARKYGKSLDNPG